jgi:2'-5' RNA ligase
MSRAPDDERPARVRLFVAVDPGPAMQRRIGKAIARVCARAPNAKWVKAENLHVTLAFLGYQDEDRTSALAEALREPASRHRPLVVSARGAGGFGSSHRPRVLWTDLTGDVDALGKLQGDVERALVPLGYEPEARPFRPHLTLARARDKGGDPALVGCIEALAAADFGEARIDELILFRSDLSRAGAQYSALARIPLS